MFVRNKSGNLAVGRVVREPEQKTFNSGKTKTTFSILYGEDAANLDENGKPKALFLSVDAWGAVGRDACLLSKGDYVTVTGRIDSHEYNGKTYTALVADAIMPDMSAMLRLIMGNLPSDKPGNNSDNLSNPVSADPFAALEDDDGELPF